MSSYPVNVGIVGLGRWAKVLTRAAVKSDKLKIVAGYSRSQETQCVCTGDRCWCSARYADAARQSRN